MRGSLCNPIIVSWLFDYSAVAVVDRTVMFSGIPSSIIGAVAQKVLFPYFSAEIREKKSIIQKVKEATFMASVGDKLYYIPLIVLIEPFVRKYLE